MQAAEARLSLRICADLPEPSLLDNAISTKSHVLAQIKAKRKQTYIINEIKFKFMDGCPDSAVGRASAFESISHHTNGVKNGTSSSLADARIKGVVLGR